MHIEQQQSLFATAAPLQGIEQIRFAPSFAAWQNAARTMLCNSIVPECCEWIPDTDSSKQSILLSSSASKKARTQRKVPRDLIPLLRAASCHSNDDRWALMYSVLWRISADEPHLLQLRSDPQVARLHKYESAVRRDAHKMKAFVRFRELDKGSPTCGRFVAWFEPDHNIIEFTASFFQRRFSNMRWSILSPKGCAHWEGEPGGALWFTPACGKECAPDNDQFEAAWKTYYKSIFNPARVKVSAMQSEMPQKYWKNLPEAETIVELIRSADQRVHSMQAELKTQDTLHCGPRPPSPAAVLARTIQEPKNDPLQNLALRAVSCQRCRLCYRATQTVFGEGPSKARLVLVGEQPGDHEDLNGKPFVGPAGRVLDQALKEAGIDRGSVYVTNAVKHFKFKANGRTRIHQQPLRDEVRACYPWIEAELSIIRPEVVVGLGAVAALSLLGKNVKITEARGKPINGVLPSKTPASLLLSYHPSHALRSAGEDDYQYTNVYKALVADLKLAASLLS
ncbi:MAG: UdgX family uracil-DNA binding protein [Pseudomonadales bacterium]